MKFLKITLALICTALMLFGAVYNIVVLPFSSPFFDLISWCAIGVAILILFLISRTGEKPSLEESQIHKVR